MAASVGMGVNMLFAIVNIVIGIVGNSSALIAGGIEATTDIISSTLLVLVLAIATKETLYRSVFKRGHQPSSIADPPRHSF